MNVAEQRPPSTLQRASQYKWWVVLMLWFICFFNYADRQAIFSVFPKLEEEFKFNKTELGLIGSAFMWVYAFGAPFAGYVGDRLRRKDLILSGCVFWSTITVLTGWCSKLWHFVTVRALEGLGETFYFPASMSLLSDYHSGKTRSRAMSLHQSSVYIGTILGSWVGALLAEHYGWRNAFYCFGVLGMLLALMLYRFLREPPRALPEASPNSTAKVAPLTVREVLPAILRHPAAILLLLGFVCANSVATVFLTWTPTFLVQKFHFKLGAAGLTGSVFIHLASAASVPLGGLLADYWARRWAGGRMLVQALGLAAGAFFVFCVGSTLQVSTLLISMTVFGLAKGLYDSNIFAALFDVVEPRARATAAGIMNFVGWGGGALGPLAVGWVSDHGRHPKPIDNMSEAIAFGGVIYVLGAVLLVTAAFLTTRKSGRLSPLNP